MKLYPRSYFYTRIWEYRPGEHVSFIGPTNSGKTTLMLPLLARSVSEDLPGYLTVMKPRDKTVTEFLRRHDGWKRIVNYPPPMGPRPKGGYVLWPVHTNDPERDEERHAEIFHRLHRDRYVKGDSIICDDEAVSLVREMRLGPDLVRIWTKGRSIGTGLWAATQRPAMVPLEMYDQAEHLFLAHDPDKRSRDRFAEIGGVNPEAVAWVVEHLPRWHWLYIRRRDRTMCVVGP
ncbi:hypothetical protein [Streptomyces sp. NPDC087787]|uniref:hypothetical protein n=1 Tax=Streptomyces sp. NPDC087787 TaxID=3365803 RepID=UPI00381A148C